MIGTQPAGNVPGFVISPHEEVIRLTGARIKSGHATIDLAQMLGTQKEQCT